MIIAETGDAGRRRHDVPGNPCWAGLTKKEGLFDALLLRRSVDRVALTDDAYSGSSDNIFQAAMRTTYSPHRARSSDVSGMRCLRDRLEFIEASTNRAEAVYTGSDASRCGLKPMSAIRVRYP
jgi:hypothetical protein